MKGPDRKLEAFKIFPYVAWLLVVFFTLFVYKITTELKATVADLEQTTNSLEATLHSQNNDSNTNFEQQKQ